MHKTDEVVITHFFVKSYKTTRTKNPECFRIQDFYFSPIHFSLERIFHTF